ncbi:MAG: hypothetical protein AB7V45_00595 [Candidatus Krumholzibacteriia bacterium]
MAPRFSGRQSPVRPSLPLVLLTGLVLSAAGPALGTATPPVRITVDAVLGEFQELGNVLGLEEGAGIGFDPALDAPEPAPPPARYLSVYFPHPDWPLGHRYLRDIQAPVADGAVWRRWRLRLETDQQGAVTLDFSHDLVDPAAWRLILQDVVTGRRRNLLRNPVVEFSQSPGAREFDVLLMPRTPEGFTLTVAGSSGALTDAGVLIGTEVGATDGFDGALDAPRPAPPPTGFLQLDLEHPDWPLGWRYGVDLRAPFDPALDRARWPLVVETDQTGPVNLTFAPSFLPIPEVNLALLDLVTGIVHDLQPSLAHTFIPGGGLHRFEILVGGPALPPPAPVEIPVPAGYSLLGFPRVPPPDLATLADVLLDQAPPGTKVFGFVDGFGYEELSPGEPVAAGSGWWIESPGPFTWVPPGERAISPVEVPLQAGWNLVGSPLWFPGDLEDVEVVQDGASHPFWGAVKLGLVHGGVFGHAQDGAPCISVGTLEPGTGCWIAALEPGLVLRFDHAAFLWGEDAPGPPRDDGAPWLERWRIPLAVGDGAGVTAGMMFGVGPSAKDGLDVLWDQLAPPAPPGGVEPSAWLNRGGRRLLRDLTSPWDEILQWEVTVRRTAAGAVTLAWNPELLPWCVDLGILRAGDGRVIVPSMQDVGSVTLTMPAGVESLIIKQVDGAADKASVPAPASGLGAFPNPFNPLTTIRFFLKEPGPASLQIVDLRGRSITGWTWEDLPAGSHSTQWNGLDAAGRPVPSGTYLGFLKTPGNAGESVSCRMNLVR